MMLLQTCRAVLPALHMEESLSFYRDLGFVAKFHDDTIAELSQGGVSFYLKAISAQTSLSCAVMIVTVPSLSEWWIRVKLLDLTKRYRVRPPHEPVLELWGQKVGYIYDPGGSAWHFTECDGATAKESTSRFTRKTISSQSSPGRSQTRSIQAAWS